MRAFYPVLGIESKLKLVANIGVFPLLWFSYGHTHPTNYDTQDGTDRTLLEKHRYCYNIIGQQADLCRFRIQWWYSQPICAVNISISWGNTFDQIAITKQGRHASTILHRSIQHSEGLDHSSHLHKSGRNYSWQIFAWNVCMSDLSNAVSPTLNQNANSCNAITIAASDPYQ